MTESGEQVRPTTTSGPSTMPRSPRMSDATGLLAVTTWLQHWMGPVEHDEAGGVLDGLAGAAAGHEQNTRQLAAHSRGSRV